MKVISLDPRVNRISDLPSGEETVIIDHQEGWITYEVFHQKKRGTQHTHVGIVHAPNAEMAIVFAKESFARRGATSNLWVVKSEDVTATDYEDADIFETTAEKGYRDAGFYKTRNKIDLLKDSESHE
jgi:ring-1,2-phenylacetyl-CoA epoxidase subunit PaaB